MTLLRISKLYSIFYEWARKNFTKKKKKKKILPLQILSTKLAKKTSFEI